MKISLCSDAKMHGRRHGKSLKLNNNCSNEIYT
jgi:hypothetical protein